MSRRDGHINAGRVDRSARLMRIVEILKDAEYPLSAQDIARLAYPSSDDVMLNVSTNIGEIRSQVNVDAGYYVPLARKWKGGKYAWHDGRPRYWLEAAPGWIPRWIVDEDGNLRRRGRESLRNNEAQPDPLLMGQCNRVLVPDEGHSDTVGSVPADSASGPPCCIKCSVPLPADHRGAPFCAACTVGIFG